MDELSKIIFGANDPNKSLQNWRQVRLSVMIDQYSSYMHLFDRNLFRMEIT